MEESLTKERLIGAIRAAAESTVDAADDLWDVFEAGGVLMHLRQEIGLHLVNRGFYEYFMDQGWSDKEWGLFQEEATALADRALATVESETRGKVERAYLGVCILGSFLASLRRRVESLGASLPEGGSDGS